MRKKSWLTQLWDSYPQLVAERFRTLLSQSQTESKPSNTGCPSGAPQSSESLTQRTERAMSAGDEDIRSTVEEASLFVNPLGASDAEDWEQSGLNLFNPVSAETESQATTYQGCKMPQWYNNVRICADGRPEDGEYGCLGRQKSGGVSVGLPTEDKARKRLQLWTFMFEYFPDAWLAVVNVAVAGNEQHNPGQPLHWAREKSTDHMNTAFRHQWDYGRGVKKDTDGQWHLAKAIWRLMAQLQLEIEKERSNSGDK